MTLFEVPGATLADANRLFSDKDYRTEAARTATNAAVREFWVKEFAGYSFAFRAVIVAPLQNTLGALLTDPRMNSIITAERTSFDLSAVMDGGKILLVNLSRGKIGEGPAQVLGALLAARMGLSGLARADQPEHERRDFHVYLDEFQMFATLSLASMLAELRKYRVSLILAHQYLVQLDPQVQAAVPGNVGTMVSFRVSATDASVLAKELDTFEPKDLVHLPNHDICLRLMIELHFVNGILQALKLIGSAVWEGKRGGRNVTFPARTYSVNGERRSVSLLRPIEGPAATEVIRDLFSKPTATRSRSPSTVNSSLASQGSRRAFRSEGTGPDNVGPSSAFSLLKMLARRLADVHVEEGREIVEVFLALKRRRARPKRVVQRARVAPTFISI